MYLFFSYQGYCEENEGTLVEIDNAPEDNFIRSHLRRGNVILLPAWNVALDL